MKCKHCDGDGVIVDVEYGHAGKYGCKYCDGKGVVEPLTEEEYIQSCDTEQLADFLTKIILDDKRFRMTMVGGVNETKLWLKQPHTNEETK